MAHFSVLVIGDHVEDQLALYDEKLEVQPYKVHMNIVDPDGHDENGPYIWCTENSRSRWNWYIEGGRWSGYLKLKHGASGELGKPAQKRVMLGQPLPYGDDSADVALMGDIDWYGMHQQRLVEAERLWMEYDRRYGLPDEHHLGMEFAIEPDMDQEKFLEVRSHPATFAVVDNSDWHARGPTGWWGVLLDATPVEDWHRTFDTIVSHLRPDTLVTIVDAHV